MNNTSLTLGKDDLKTFNFENIMKLDDKLSHSDSLNKELVEDISDTPKHKGRGRLIEEINIKTRETNGLLLRFSQKALLATIAPSDYLTEKQLEAADMHDRSGNGGSPNELFDIAKSTYVKYKKSKIWYWLGIIFVSGIEAMLSGAGLNYIAGNFIPEWLCYTVPGVLTIIGSIIIAPAMAYLMYERHKEPPSCDSNPDFGTLTTKIG